MIHFQKGTQATFIVTLTEKVTLLDPNYLFVFESSLGDRVAFVLLNSDDNSLFLGRYNQFTITVDDHFPSAVSMLWTYKVYEQASEDNTDETGLNCLETGYMKLLSANAFSTTSYSNNPSQIKAFNAE